MSKSGLPLSLEKALAMYRPLVENNEQAVPMLLLGWGTKVSTNVCGREKLMAMAEAVRLGLAESRVEWAMYTAESWFKSFAAEDALAASFDHGDLELLRKAGDTTVKEAVACTCWARDGEVFAGNQGFVRHSVGNVEWGPVEDLTGTQHSGVIGEALAAICGARP